jgi:hypothetical protein
MELKSKHFNIKYYGKRILYTLWKKLKSGKGHYECYECRSIQEFARKGGNAPKHMIDKAFKALTKIPLLWKVILFSILISLIVLT